MHRRNKKRKNDTIRKLSWKLYYQVEAIKDSIGIDEEFAFRDLILSPKFSWLACVLLFFAEIIVNILVIIRVPYTEIDWKAYMSEVEGFINGTLDYSKLNGSTGPLVYPAGFVYIYSALYYLTAFGKNIFLAQVVFAVIYMANLAVIFRMYLKSTEIPPYMYVLLSCIAYRVHSIYVLRLFNDPIAMLFLYTAVYMFVSNKWFMGCVLFSLGVSVKMNVLLFAPGLLVLLLQFHSPFRTIFYLFICGITQVVLGLPFLLSHPVSYLTRAFQFNRQFIFRWTVNWKFLPEHIFHHRAFHLALFLALLSLLLLFLVYKWNSIKFRPLIDFNRMSPIGEFSMETRCHILYVLFTSNFCGIVTSRTLHYQFYVWYFHTLHFLIWKTNYPAMLGLCLLGLIELTWKVDPSTDWSSALLHACHFVILGKLF